RHAATEHLRMARARQQQSAEHADGGRLAGTVGAEEAVDRRARDLDAHTVDRGHGAEPARQAFGADGDVGRRRAHFVEDCSAGNPTGAGTPGGRFWPAESVRSISARYPSRPRSCSVSAKYGVNAASLAMVRTRPANACGWPSTWIVAPVPVVTFERIASGT